MAQTARPEQRRVARWRYVIPNAITCTSLMLGLIATFFAMQGTREAFLEAAWLIILCVLLDKLDGTAARLLKATSPVGAQLDSFSDFVTFGIAPAYLVYMMMLTNADGHYAIWQGDVSFPLLHALSGAFVLCSCIRLAKFNVLAAEEHAEDAPNVFYGMPTTSAGGLVATVTLVCFEHDLFEVLQWLPVLTIVLGLLMVTNLPLPKVGLRKSKVLNVLQFSNIAAAYVCGVARVFPEYLLSLVMIYVLGGFTWGFIHRAELAPRRLDPYPQ